LQPGNELSRESGWKIPPTDDARLTMINWVGNDVYQGNITMIGGVDYESDDGEGLVSIDGLPLKMMFGSGEKGWGRGSLI